MPAVGLGGSAARLITLYNLGTANVSPGTPPDLMFYGWDWGMIHLGMGKGMRPLSPALLATQRYSEVQHWCSDFRRILRRHNVSARPLPDCLQALFVPALILRQRGLMGSWLADRTAVNMLAPYFSYQK
ncbi:hypothetical protein AOLI_G00049330 [Acnodon oligacanthus]